MDPSAQQIQSQQSSADEYLLGSKTGQWLKWHSEQFILFVCKIKDTLKLLSSSFEAL